MQSLTDQSLTSMLFGYVVWQLDFYHNNMSCHHLRHARGGYAGKSVLMRANAKLCQTAHAQLSHAALHQVENVDPSCCGTSMK